LTKTWVETIEVETTKHFF